MPLWYPRPARGTTPILEIGMNWHAAVSLLVVLAPWASARADPNAIEVADQYLAAYQQQDLDRLEELYAEDARFLDPTSTRAGLASGPVAWIGRSEIMRNLRATDGTTVVLQYDILRKFEALRAWLSMWRTYPTGWCPPPRCGPEPHRSSRS